MVEVLIVTVQVVAEPEQAPLQPENALPAAGAAVNVTRVPLANVWLHPVEPEQLIPAGLEVTLPLPPTVTCSESFCTAAAKVAPTLWGAFIGPEHVGALPANEHPPVQPTKVLPDAGAADGDHKGRGLRHRRRRIGRSTGSIRDISTAACGGQKAGH